MIKCCCGLLAVVAVAHTHRFDNFSSVQLTSGGSLDKRAKRQDRKIGDGEELVAEDDAYPNPLQAQSVEKVVLAPQRKLEVIIRNVSDVEPLEGKNQVTGSQILTVKKIVEPQMKLQVIIRNVPDVDPQEGSGSTPRPQIQTFESIVEVPQMEVVGKTPFQIVEKTVTRTVEKTVEKTVYKPMAQAQPAEKTAVKPKPSKVDTVIHIHCNTGSHQFDQSPGVPDDCQRTGLVFGVEGRNALNPFGLRYCFNTSSKISWYVQYKLRQNQTRERYQRKGIMFKMNPRLSACKQQAPSWYGCAHQSKKNRKTPNWCGWFLEQQMPVPQDCINHPVQPSRICNKMVFSGGQCKCPKKFGDNCSVDKDICMGYSGYENQVCGGWAKLGKDLDYDRGHLAASSDVYDDLEAKKVCDQPGGVPPNEWTNPYGRSKKGGFERGQWHRADYGKCAWTASFLMTNVVPQGSLLNQVCWLDIENALKDYSEGKLDLLIVVGNSRAGTMRGQKTPLEKGYDSKSDDMVLIPKYMWKAACSTTMPRKCTAWLVANRNIPVPEGCRTPLTLTELTVLLDDLDELQDGWIPGMRDVYSSELLPDLKVKCGNEYKPGYCNVQGGMEYSSTAEDVNLVSLDYQNGNKSIQMTCDSGETCIEYCRCCDTDFIQKMKNVKQQSSARPQFTHKQKVKMHSSARPRSADRKRDRHELLTKLIRKATQVRKRLPLINIRGALWPSPLSVFNVTSDSTEPYVQHYAS